VVQHIADIVGQRGAAGVQRDVEAVRDQLDRRGVLQHFEEDAVAGLQQARGAGEAAFCLAEGHDGEHLAVGRREAGARALPVDADRQLAVQDRLAGHVDLVVAGTGRVAAKLDFHVARCGQAQVAIALLARRIARRQRAGVQQCDIGVATALQHVVGRDRHRTVHEAFALGQLGEVIDVMVDREVEIGRRRRREILGLIDQAKVEGGHIALMVDVMAAVVGGGGDVVIVIAVRQHHHLSGAEHWIGRKQDPGLEGFHTEGITDFLSNLLFLEDSFHAPPLAELSSVHRSRGSANNTGPCILQCPMRTQNAARHYFP